MLRHSDSELASFEQFTKRIQKFSANRDLNITDVAKRLFESKLTAEEKLQCLASNVASPGLNFFIIIMQQKDLVSLQCMQWLSEMVNASNADTIYRLLMTQDKAPHYATGLMYFTAIRLENSDDLCTAFLQKLEEILDKNYFNPMQIYNLISQGNVHENLIGIVLSWHKKASIALLNLLMNIRKKGVKENKIHELFTKRYGTRMFGDDYTNIDVLKKHESVRVIFHYINSGILSEKSYDAFLDQKKIIKKYIFAIKDKKKKQLWLENASNPDHPLGKFFWKPRYPLLPSPSLNKGKLREISDELKKLQNEIKNNTNEEAITPATLQNASKNIVNEDAVAFTMSEEMAFFILLDPGIYIFVDSITQTKTFAQWVQFPGCEPGWLEVAPPNSEMQSEAFLITEVPVITNLPYESENDLQMKDNYSFSTNKASTSSYAALKALMQEVQSGTEYKMSDFSVPKEEGSEKKLAESKPPKKLNVTQNESKKEDSDELDLISFPSVPSTEIGEENDISSTESKAETWKQGNNMTHFQTVRSIPDTRSQQSQSTVKPKACTG